LGRKGQPLRRSALHYSNDQNDHSDYEKQMYQSPTNMADESEQPEHEQNYEDSPEHKLNLLFANLVRMHVRFIPVLRIGKTY
jgi:hypothetical protein